MRLPPSIRPALTSFERARRAAYGRVLGAACATAIAAWTPTAGAQAAGGGPAVRVRAGACTDTGAAAVPSAVVPGLAAGPHSFIANGVRQWYCVAGRTSAAAAGVPAPVIFLHGGPGQGSYHFAALNGPSLEATLRLVYYDQRGSGHSERPANRAYSLPLMVDDIEALRQALGVPRVALLAHSFAGALALEYAAKYPEHVARMVLYDAISDVPASSRSQCEALAQADSAAYARSGPNGARPASPAECSVFRGLSGPAVQAFFRANMFPDTTVSVRLDSVAAASGMRNTGEMSGVLFGRGGLSDWRFAASGRLTMPVLVIVGARDRQVGLEPPRDLARGLPNARLLVYERSGHYPNLDEPARFTRDVAAFLGVP